MYINREDGVLAIIFNFVHIVQPALSAHFTHGYVPLL